MNDTELDELLNTWKTPPVPPSLRQGIRAGIAVRHTEPPRKLPGWRLLMAGAAVAAVVILLADTSAFTQKASLPPYTVDSKLSQHYDRWPHPSRVPASRVSSDWGAAIESGAWIGLNPENVLLTSYNEAANEVILSWSDPDHPLEAELWAAKLAVNRTIQKLKRTFLMAPDLEAADHAGVYLTLSESSVVTERATLLNSGCQSPGPQGKIVGKEVILNYPTIAAEYGFWKRRMTVWMAPALSCFALRATMEAEQPDGSWTLVSEKQALKVTINHQ